MDKIEIEKLKNLVNSELAKPYSLPLELCNADVGSSCLGKHYRLKKAIEEIGILTRWVEGTFRWDDLPIPKDILTLPHEDPAYHVWLEIFIDNEWRVVDVSWDEKLSSVLPANKWSYPLNMKIAVPVIELVPKEKIEITFSPLPEWQEEIEYNKKFFMAVNEWMESIRR